MHMPISDLHCESQLVTQKGQTADWALFSPVCLNSKLRDCWHELTSTLIVSHYVVCWKDNDRWVSTNQWERKRENEANTLRTEKVEKQKEYTLHNVSLSQVHCLENMLICSLSLDSTICSCIWFVWCLGRLKWKTHKDWCCFFPQFTVKRNGLSFVRVYRFIGLYARVWCRPQDLRFSAEKCLWNINKAVSY